jgi:hypothetical protein
MITKRDKLMLAYLQEYKCAHTSTLREFYPDLRTTQRRLKALYENHEVGRARDNINAEYIYYLIKPKQLRHSVLLTDFLREFSRIATIESCKPEVTIGNIRADALIGYKRKGVRHLAFVEVQISNAALDIQKYEKLYYSKEWEKKIPLFPSIIVITDRKIPDTKLQVIRINEDLSNLKEG